MKLNIKVNTDINAMMDQLGDDIAGGLFAGTTNVLARAETKITPYVPVRTSNLVNSGVIDVSPDGSVGVLRYTADYGRFVNDGTGIFGPSGQKIVPKSKKALYWSGAKHPVKSVKGMEGRHFVEKGVADIDPQRDFEDGMENYLKKKGVTK
jgi:hypothetical protein